MSDTITKSRTISFEHDGAGGLFVLHYDNGELSHSYGLRLRHEHEAKHAEQVLSRSHQLAIESAVNAERERCARIAEARAEDDGAHSVYFTAHAIASEIRGEEQ